jgi:hypothetical protein
LSRYPRTRRSEFADDLLERGRVRVDALELLLLAALPKEPRDPVLEPPVAEDSVRDSARTLARVGAPIDLFALGGRRPERERHGYGLGLLAPPNCHAGGRWFESRRSRS